MNETTDIVVSQPELRMPNVPALATIESIKELARMAAQSGLAKTKSPYDAFFVAMYGMELGIPPMTAMRTIYSVGGGAPTCSGEAMLSLLRGSGKVRVTIPDPSTVKDSATITIKRLDTGESGEYTFTMKMAVQAGLANGNNWKKYPHMMLIWRAVSMGAKLLCSDIIGGLYTNEEIYPDMQVDETGAIVGSYTPDKAIAEHTMGLDDIPLPDPEPPTAAPPEKWNIHDLAEKLQATFNLSSFVHAKNMALKRLEDGIVDIRAQDLPNAVIHCMYHDALHKLEMDEDRVGDILAQAIDEDPPVNIRRWLFSLKRPLAEAWDTLLAQRAYDLGQDPFADDSAGDEIPYED